MKIYSWGSNSHGQLGQGTDADQILLPVPIDISVKPKLISGGGKHTVLVTIDNEIFSCGDNSMGQLGRPSSLKPVKTFQEINVRLKVAKVSCGWDFTVVLTENLEVFAWGSNSFGQLGLSVDKVKFLSTPFKILDTTKVVDVAAGLRHSAIVTSDGCVFTSGFGRKGQLGFYLNSTIPSIVDKFTLVKGINNCQEISCGENYCIAKTENENYYSWGNNKYGQLGFNPSSTVFSATPIQIVFAEILEKSHLFSGWAHNVMLTDKKQIISWGRNDFGQLGEQREVNWKPKLLSSIKNIKQVCLGSHHTVVLTENNEVFTWGWNEHGNCGNEMCDDVLKPFKLETFSSVKLIGSGAAHSFFSF